MHCDSRLPVPPVVLYLDHDVENVPTYQFSAKSDNPRLSYSELTIFDLHAFRHLGYDRTGSGF